MYEADDYYAYDDPSRKSRFYKFKTKWLRRNRNYDARIEVFSTIDGLAYYLLVPYLGDRMWWIPYKNGATPTFIDVGCGAGKMVKQMATLGFEAWGTDISSHGASVGVGSGLNIANGDLATVELPEGYFDYLHSNHAIEHMENPQAVFKKIRRILKPGGTGYICVPNAEAITSLLFGRYWYFLGTPIHFINYTEKALRILLERNGLQVIKVKKVGDYQAIVGSIQAFLNRNSKRTSSEGRVFNNVAAKGIGVLLAYIGTLFNVGSHLQIQFRKS